MAPRPPDPASDRAHALVPRDAPRPEVRPGGVRGRIVRALGLRLADEGRERRLREDLARSRHAERLLMRVYEAAERAHGDWVADEPLDEAMQRLRAELRTAAELTA